MERKNWSTKNYSEIQPYLNGDKMLIKTVEATRSHQTLVYWIPPSGRSARRGCDECDQAAEYLYYDEDHTRQYYLRLYCREHAAAYPFKSWLSERE